MGKSRRLSRPIRCGSATAPDEAGFGRRYRPRLGCPYGRARSWCLGERENPGAGLADVPAGGPSTKEIRIAGAIRRKVDVPKEVRSRGSRNFWRFHYEARQEPSPGYGGGADRRGRGSGRADLPVKKAIPIEYVRVCTAYGAGFFYIPGTDTCLRVSGRARAEYGYIGSDSRNVPAAATSRASPASRASTSTPAPRPATAPCAPSCASTPPAAPATPSSPRAPTSASATPSPAPARTSAAACRTSSTSTRRSCSSPA